MRRHFVLSVEAFPCVEPKHDMNSSLEPIVIELLELQHGVSMTVSTSQTDIFIQCLLLSVTCDLPAVRKILGFSARLGCSKWLKEFPTLVLTYQHGPSIQMNYIIKMLSVCFKLVPSRIKIY